MSRFHFYTALILLVVISVGCDREEQTEPDAGATDAQVLPDADAVTTDAPGDTGACDRFCVWDRLMEQSLRAVYGRCICNRTSSPDSPIQEGVVLACENGYVQTSLVVYEPDCVQAMTEAQIAEIQSAIDCSEPVLDELLPCLDGLGAGDTCGSCEPLDQPEGVPGRCPTSYETNLMIRRCTDGRPGF
jgi:hypothetical protein